MTLSRATAGQTATIMQWPLVFYWWCEWATFVPLTQQWLFLLSSVLFATILYALGKAHIMHSIPSLGSFPNVAFETVLMFIWYMMAFLLKTWTHIFWLLFFVSCQIKHHSSFKLFVIWSWTMTKHWVKIWLFSSDVMAMKGLNNLKPSKITFVTGLVY